MCSERGGYTPRSVGDEKQIPQPILTHKHIKEYIKRFVSLKVIFRKLEGAFLEIRKKEIRRCSPTKGQTFVQFYVAIIIL